MRSIRQIDYKKLNSEVRLVGMCDIVQTQWRRKHFLFEYEAKDAHYSDTYDLRFDRLSDLPGRLFEPTTEVDGQPMFVWTSVKAWVDTWLAVYRERDNYVDFVARVFEKSHGGFFADMTSEEMREKIEQLRKLSKVNKHGYATVPNTIRALCTIYGFANAEDIIKQVMTLIKAEKKPLYLYATTDYIENHYDQLRQTQSLNSCMTKGTESLDADHHYIKVDKAKANAQGYRTRATNSNSSVFMPNIASLNNTEGVALGLTSFYSPEELKELNEYGFTGRCVMVERDGEWTYTRYYGREGVREVLPSIIKPVKTFKGVRLKGYVSAITDWEEMRTVNNVTYILPYMDGDDNIFMRVGDKQTDEIGRPYYWFEVAEGNRRDNKIPDCKTGNYFYLDQSSWFVRPMRYTAKCAVTGEEVTEETGWLIAEGIHICYNLVPVFNMLLDVMGRDVNKTVDSMRSVVSPIADRLVRRVEEYQIQLGIIENRLHDMRRKYDGAIGNSRNFERLSQDIALRFEDWYFRLASNKAQKDMEELYGWVKRTMTNDKSVWRKYGYTFAMVWNENCRNVVPHNDQSTIHVLLNTTVSTMKTIFEGALALANDDEYKRIRRLVDEFTESFNSESSFRPTTRADKSDNGVVESRPSYGETIALEGEDAEVKLKALMTRTMKSLYARRINLD